MRIRTAKALMSGPIPKTPGCDGASDPDMTPDPQAEPFFPGFYAILDTGYVAASDWTAKAEALLSGGARLIQIRAKGEPLEAVQALAEAVAPLAARRRVPLIINDHLELALRIPGAGLHLGQDDGDIRLAREQLGPDRILGLSTHSIGQAKAAIAAAGCLSYFAVGPVYATGTKPDYTPVGAGLVRQVSALRPPIPFYCIGGIHRGNLDQVLAAGARGIVAVSDPLLDPDTAAAAHEFAQRIAAWPGA
jgi:thiamine-phosphate pyrophosphorylase